jgi:hypothetical protein
MRSVPLHRAFPRAIAALAAATTLLLVPAAPAMAASPAELSGGANQALKSLYAKVPAAKAKAILVFPKGTNAGLGIPSILNPSW